MKPYYNHDGITIYHGDCREILPTLRDVHCLITDPPYGIRKQPADYPFAEYAEGDILKHVRANQPKFQAAVFAVCREWHRLGKPRLKTTDHDFKSWARALGWIVEHLLGEAPLLADHRGEQRRISTPSHIWLRTVALTVNDAGLNGRWLRANQLLDVLVERSVDIPGVADGSLQDDEVRTMGLMGIGRRLATCFGDTDVLTIDRCQVQRRSVQDNAGRTRQEFYFLAQTPQSAPRSPMAVASSPRDIGHSPRFPAIPAGDPNFLKTSEPDVELATIDDPRDGHEFVPDFNSVTETEKHTVTIGEDNKDCTHARDGAEKFATSAGIAGNRGKTGFHHGDSAGDRGKPLKTASAAVPQPEAGCPDTEEPPIELLHARIDAEADKVDGKDWGEL